MSWSWSTVPWRRPETLRCFRYSRTARLASTAVAARRVRLPASMAASSYCASFSVTGPSWRARTLPPSRHSMAYVVSPEDRSMRERSQAMRCLRCGGRDYLRPRTPKSSNSGSDWLLRMKFAHDPFAVRARSASIQSAHSPRVRGLGSGRQKWQLSRFLGEREHGLHNAASAHNAVDGGSVRRCRGGRQSSGQPSGHWKRWLPGASTHAIRLWRDLCDRPPPHADFEPRLLGLQRCGSPLNIGDRQILPSSASRMLRVHDWPLGIGPAGPHGIR